MIPVVNVVLCFRMYTIIQRYTYRDICFEQNHTSKTFDEYFEIFRVEISRFKNQNFQILKIEIKRFNKVKISRFEVDISRFKVEISRFKMSTF